MGMDKINGAPHFQRSAIDKFQKTSHRTDEAEAGSGASESAGIKGQKSVDKAEISDAAHDLMELRQAVDTGRAALEALPDVRQDKVETARTRLAQGYYNSVEVRDRVAEKLDKVISAMDQR